MIAAPGRKGGEGYVWCDPYPLLNIVRIFFVGVKVQQTHRSVRVMLRLRLAATTLAALGMALGAEAPAATPENIFNIVRCLVFTRDTNYPKEGKKGEGIQESIDERKCNRYCH